MTSFRGEIESRRKVYLISNAELAPAMFGLGPWNNSGTTNDLFPDSL